MAHREIHFIAAAPTGHIDSDTSPSFRRDLDTKLNSIRTRKPFDFVLDLSNVDYMSSMGIRELLRAHQNVHKRGGRLILNMVNEQIEGKLRLTGLESLLSEKKI